MKKIILTVASLLTMATLVNAQEVSESKKEVSEKKSSGVEKKSKQQAVNKKGGHKAMSTPEQRAQKSVDALNAEVVLTEDQKPKVYDLALNRARQVDTVREKYKGQSENREVGKKEIETIRKDYREKVKAILTPEQLEKLKAKHKEKKAQGKPNSLEDND